METRKRRGGRTDSEGHNKKTKSGGDASIRINDKPSTSGGYGDADAREPVKNRQPSTAKVSTRGKFDSYFEITILTIDGERVKGGICKLCQQKGISNEIKMKDSNTSGLKWHLSKCHSDIFKEFFPDESVRGKCQPSILESLHQGNKMKDLDPVEFDIRTVEFIAVKYLALNFFSDDCSQEYFKYLNPTISYSKRTSMTKKVARVFTAARNIVKSVLQDNTSEISFT